MNANSNFSLILRVLLIACLALIIVSLVTVVNSGAVIISSAPAGTPTVISPQLRTPPSVVNPIIVYNKTTNNSSFQRFAVCGNPSCSAGNVLRTLADGGTNYYLGMNNDMIKGADGTPIIVYDDYGPNGSSPIKIKLLKCNDSVCLSGFTTNFVETNSMLAYTDPNVALLSNGNPAVAYMDYTNQDLKYAVCANPSCSNVSSIAVVDFNGSTGDFISFKMGSDNLPIITYRHAWGAFNNDYAKVAHCENTSCTTKTISILDETYSGYHNDMAIGSDGKPIIAYLRNASTPNGLGIIHCGNVRCNAGNTITTVETPFLSQVGFSMEIGSDGLPIVAYTSYLDTNGSEFYLKVLHCGNNLCSSGNTITALDVNAGGPSLTIASDGKPVISYMDLGNEDLKAVKCTNVSCTQFSSPIIVEGASQSFIRIGGGSSIK